MTVDPTHKQVLGGLRRVQTADDESDIDNDDEFLPPALVTAGFDDEDYVKVRFDQDLEDALAFVQSLASRKPSKEQKSAQLLDFVDSRKMEWHKTTRDGQNFLHVLTYCNSVRKPATSLQWLMSRTMLRLPHLMGSMDKTKRTPLPAALSNGNEVFSYAACLDLKPGTRQRFKEPLERSARTKAATEDLRQDIIKIMCSFVPDKMFTVTDHRGRTPLHLAVEYERCCKAQVGIAGELLRWGPQALDIPIQAALYSNRTFSVYQYHVHTQRQVEARTRMAVEETSKKTAQGTPRKEDDSEARTSSNTKKPMSRPEKITMGPPPSLRDRDRDGVAEPKVGIARSHTTVQPQEIPASSYMIVADHDRAAASHTAANTQEKQTPVSVSSSALPPVGASKASAYSLAPRQDAADPLSAEKEKERQDAAADISHQLKHIYQRTQKPEDAARCLNVGGVGKELWFDFGPSKKLTRADFRKHFGHLRFDAILQYLAFPQMELDDHKQIPDSRYAGKEDMTFFFEWLRQQGVSRIIKVIVDDLQSPSHSDTAIKKALKPFSVEILDWRRLDLDPVSLSEASQCLREVNLHWSGRNAVLRAWSEKEGLALIPTLEVINLIQTEGLESAERIRENLDTFEKRLHESWPEDRPKPTINRPKTGGGRVLVRGLSVDALADRQERSVGPHRWMQCMENFAEHFRQIPALRDKIRDPSLEPVEVALIDDGADITRPDLGDMKGKKFPGKSFCYYQEGSTWRVSPYWDSSSGHGTLMARLIHKICPSAVIHVIKLQTFDVENSNKLQINPDSATKAIEYAAERGSQIIAMSWTIKPPEGDKKKEFDDVIHNALNSKGVLMFCAASDQGKSADLTYPHGSNRASFLIGAAKATGSMSDTVGDAHDLDFIFPGHQVVVSSDDVYESDLQKFEAHSGSSVANALAAGLAALVIECVRLEVFYTNETKQVDPMSAIRKDDLIKIRDRNQMKYALSWIGTNRNTDNKYIEVWDTFNAVAEKLRQNEGSRIDRLENIATLARFFLKKGVNYGE